MPLRAEQLKSELIEAVLVLIRSRLPAAQVGNAECFVRQCYANASPEDVAAASPDLLYGAALALLRLAARRPAGTPCLRLYTPRIDQHGWQASHTVMEIVTDDMPFLVDSVTAALNRCGLTVHTVFHPVIPVVRDGEGRLIGLPAPDDGAAGARPESFIHIQVDRESDPDRLAMTRRTIETVLADIRQTVADWPAMRATLRGIVAGLDAEAALPRTPSPIPAAEVAEMREFLRWLDNDHFTYLGYRRHPCAPTRHAGGDAPAGATGEPAPVAGSGLGLLRDEATALFDAGRVGPALEARIFQRPGEPLQVIKTDRRSTVHRPILLDAVFIKEFDDSGATIGGHVLVGLFTSAAYHRMVADIPFLRRKVTQVMERAAFRPLGHNARALTHILGSLPRDELFQASVAELHDIAVGVLHLQERSRIALFVRRDPFERFVSCLVFVPRDRYDTVLRRRLQAVLEASFQGTTAAFYTQISDSALARLHFIVNTTPGATPAVEIGEVEAGLIEAARGWPDRLRAALLESCGEEEGGRLHTRYANAFPVSYTERYGAEAAVLDIRKIEELCRGAPIVINLCRPLEAGEDELRLKLYLRGEEIALSDILPMLEHMDLRVIAELPFDIRPAGPAGEVGAGDVGGGNVGAGDGDTGDGGASDNDNGRGAAPRCAGTGATVWLHEFVAATRTGAAIDLDRDKEAFQQALAMVRDGSLESDGFNRLILRAGLRASEVTILRAYARYLRQIGFRFSLDYMADTLVAQPHIARLIVRLFLARFTPEAPTSTAATAAIGLTERLFDEITRALEAVRSLEEDLILKRFLSLTVATLRTNYFQRDPDGRPKPCLAFKFDSQAIPELPLPRPWVEIFVYSPRVEAIHLRGGRVARGGIRWSDRREDFRTEILGLMKAQMVKNALIVPVGSKGGFVVKRPPPPGAGRDAVLAEGIACYQTMMGGLLDLTDTAGVGGTVVPPARVVRHDGDDPYLVVAADKGTASFSDIANQVARHYGYWLDDAFASGGSAGYDHKRMGITARGAWESVKRHFRELGRDCQREAISCVAVGDMSGDVFGNAMLMSRTLHVVGAFNHQHIFLDPAPDPEAAHAERRRLFALPRSGWGDYSAKAISAGGGVFERTLKAIPVSAEVRALLGLGAEVETITPAGLIQALLAAEVDLLFFGGIGTFVKAKGESAAEVGDKANDALRIDATRLRARVIGEGANLGVTQRARIEAASRGIRLNTDAIDNAGGVACSDREVNIKILLGDVVAAGELTLRQRDTLLAEMTDEVAELVLTDVYLQTQTLSVAEADGVEGLRAQAELIRSLEKAGRLNRAVETLPDEEALAARLHDRRGLTRPELAVLLAYAKVSLHEALLDSSLPEEPTMAEELRRYFPKPLRRRFPDAMARHRLRREIVTTVVANSMVNRLGPTFVHQVSQRTGLGAADIARAYAIVRAAFDLRPLWTAIQELDGVVPAATQIAMIRAVGAMVERTVIWLLGHGRHPLDIAAETASLRPGVEALFAALDGVLARDGAAAFARECAALEQAGVPAALARRVAAMPVLAQAADIIHGATATGRPVPVVAAVYFALGQRFGIAWLRGRAREIRRDSGWQEQAVNAIVDDLFAHQSQLTLRVFDGLAAGGGGMVRAAEGGGMASAAEGGGMAGTAGGGKTGEISNSATDAIIDAWIAGRQPAVDRIRHLLAELHDAPALDLAMLAVANRHLRGLFAG